MKPQVQHYQMNEAFILATFAESKSRHYARPRVAWVRGVKPEKHVQPEKHVIIRRSI